MLPNATCKEALHHFNPSANSYLARDLSLAHSRAYLFGEGAMRKHLLGIYRSFEDDVGAFCGKGPRTPSCRGRLDGAELRPCLRPAHCLTNTTVLVQRHVQSFMKINGNHKGRHRRRSV